MHRIEVSASGSLSSEELSALVEDAAMVNPTVVGFAEPNRFGLVACVPRFRRKLRGRQQAALGRVLLSHGGHGLRCSLHS